MRRFSQLICLIALLAFTAGCSYNRAWERAARTPTPHDDIIGRWEGTWTSRTNRHQGRLRCLLTRDETGAYRARFHAKFFRVIGASYTLPMEITRDEGQFKLRAERNLGWLWGGIFTCEGAVSPTNFYSVYRSKADHGTFQMTRPR